MVDNINFKPADTNNDGVIDKTEAAKWKKQQSSKGGKYDYWDAAADYSYASAVLSSDTSGSLKEFFTKVSQYISQNGAPPTSKQLNDWSNETTWFQDYNSAQQKAILEKNNPLTKKDYEDSVLRKKQTILALSRSYGADISDTVAEDLAEKSKIQAWTDEDIKSNLSQYIEAAVTGNKDLTGAAGAFQTQLSQWAAKQGLDLTPSQLAPFIARGAMSEQSLDDAKQQLRKTFLTGMYPAWADEINKGIDPDTLFAPAAQRASSLLEREVSTSDPAMARLTQRVGTNGKIEQVPYYDIDRIIRTDPELKNEWEKTDNAYKTYTDVGTNLLKMFGLR